MSSTEAMTWAWEQEVPPIQKIVLLAIADGGSVSEYALSRKTLLNPRSVRHALFELDLSGRLAEVRRRHSS